MGAADVRAKRAGVAVEDGVDVECTHGRMVPLPDEVAVFLRFPVATGGEGSASGMRSGN